MDIDATVVLAHSEKEQAAPTWKKTFGFCPLTAFADHGAQLAGANQPLPPRRQKGQTPGPVEPRLPGATAGPPATAGR